MCKKAMSLPAWVEEKLGRWSSKQGNGYLDVFKALEIAWEALDTEPLCEARRHCTCRNVQPVLKQAMRRIEEVGK